MLRDTVARYPEGTLAECQAVLAAQRSRRVSVPPICCVLQQLELPRKKSLAASEGDEKARTKFWKLTGALEVGKDIFIDEMGSTLGLTRLYGQAAPGQRVCDAVPGDRGGNVSTIGALGTEGRRTGLRVPGPIDGETLLFCVEELLVPPRKRGDIVFMDNHPIHKLDDSEDAIEAAGAWVLFLPTYSPDLNPIANCWSKVKAILRSLKPRTLEELLARLVDAFSSITVLDILEGAPLWLSGHTHLKTALRHLEKVVTLAEELVERGPPELRRVLEHSASQTRGHRDVIARFGRHPHRNAVLGRQSTPEELEYLANGQLIHTRSIPP